MNQNAEPFIVLKGASEGGTGGCHPAKSSLLEPAGEINLASMLSVGMYPDFPYRLRPEQMHGVRQHYGAFVKVTVQLAGNRPWAFDNQIIERHRELQIVCVVMRGVLP